MFRNVPRVFPACSRVCTAAPWRTSSFFSGSCFGSVVAGCGELVCVQSIQASYGGEKTLARSTRRRRPRSGGNPLVRWWLGPPCVRGGVLACSRVRKSFGKFFLCVRACARARVCACSKQTISVGLNYRIGLLGFLVRRRRCRRCRRCRACVAPLFLLPPTPTSTFVVTPPAFSRLRPAACLCPLLRDGCCGEECLLLLIELMSANE